MENIKVLSMTVLEVFEITKDLYTLDEEFIFHKTNGPAHVYNNIYEDWYIHGKYIKTKWLKEWSKSWR